ncbi:3-methyl-2-oxobutanoate hydroxymethyltransferase [Legionella londiniensis]|uniref:3-methyl-2-oxobutanoate hydroxymethyltransferase n=1 Tax=Legionella londiniensis TaxID=45068 RepID=A0A0W0VSG4_9GAMM|nr:3-methyl-2-oxobutanoate hydroxymethyltransferase [Legionella londiniensis]KTD23042.1 3-methyl-2-oxobutanoate hydroxymethyltransferase [Legionella londiniensis]STX94059.1 3-methyl-2-oxobutanoate hydroxymethyltransferase [Legionella londiniensis]
MKIHDFKRKKEQQAKISMVTCYDYPSALIVAESDIDCVLVGDSVAMVVHGHDSTVMATMEMMVMHTAAVARGLSTQFLISDLPFLSHRASQAATVEHVKQLIQAGAHGVKIEGADSDVYQTIAHLVSSGVPVMGHIGLTPQHIHQLGGYRVQGKHQEQAAALLHQAKNLEKAGCFALVIECVPETVAKEITDALTIPTIGIGAGMGTDGQVLVWHDLLGLQSQIKPRFVKQFIPGKDLLLKGINEYAKEVQKASFPGPEHVF